MRICPNCGSSSVRPSKNIWIGSANLMDSNSWECKDCGYSGVMPEGDPEEFERSDISFEGSENSENRDSDKPLVKTARLEILFLVVLAVIFLFVKLL